MSSRSSARTTRVRSDSRPMGARRKRNGADTDSPGEPSGWRLVRASVVGPGSPCGVRTSITNAVPSGRSETTSATVSPKRIWIGGVTARATTRTSSPPEALPIAGVTESRFYLISRGLQQIDERRAQAFVRFQDQNFFCLGYHASSGRKSKSVSASY